MTDRGLLSQFDPEATGVPSPPSPPSPQKPAEADGSLFAQFDPEKVGAVGPQPESTAFGAARRAAGRGVLPAAGGIVGFGAGAEIGGVAGMAVGGPVGAFVGALGGGLIGSMGASWGVSKAQDAALASMPESWQDALGQSESQRIADETKHPMASFLGGVVPFAVTMRPGASAPFLAKLPENATALQRILANPATARVFGGGLMGGMELGTEFAHGDVDWRKVAISTGMGLVLNKQTKLGDTIMGVGQSGARAVIPSGTMRRYEEMRGSPTLAQAADEKVAGAGVTEEVFHGTERQDPGAERAAQNTARTEAVAFGEPEVKVDPHDVARRMEPELFARRDALEAQIDSFRRTIAEHHNPPESAFVDAEARAQRIQDELTAHIEAQNGYVGGKEARRLRAELRDAQGVVEELRGRQARYSAGLAEETPELAAIRQRLVAADMEMRDLGREIAASYRRAEEHIGGGHSVPAPAPLPETPPTRFWSLPEMIAATDGSQRPAGVSAPAATAPTGDRTAIVADVKQRLMRTGMREDEAAANAEIWGAYYETRAARFAGARGSALDLYRASAPDIAGPTGRLSPFEIGPAAAKSRLAPPPAEPPKVGGRTLMQEGGLFGEGVRAGERQGELFQAQASGKIRIVPGKRSLITLAAKSDASTFMHESGHQFLEDLMADAMHAAAPAQLKDDADTVLRWLGAKSAEDIKTKHHEKFARGFEQYLREGVAPSTGLVHVFAQFKTWLTAIYQTLRGLGKPISDDIRGVFDRMLAETPERTVIVPERERAPLPHETHERDAELTHPAEADAAADRIRFETDSAQAAPPQEIAHEIAAALQKDAAAQAGRAGQPAGEAGRGAPAAGDMAPGGAGPGPVAGGEPVGARSQPELRGGGEAAAERAGVRGDDRGPGTGDGLGDAPFATRPTHRVDAASESPFVDKAGNIRVENLTTREDVAQAIRDSAEANNDFIADRRGVVTDGQVMDLAADLGMRYTDLLQRKVGEAFNAEQVVAARKLLVQSATDVAAAMKKAATGTEQDVIAYAQARDRHHLIQAQIAGITAEAGRALRAFRDISMTGEAAAADQIVRQATGRTLFQLRREAQLGLALETPQQVSAWMRATQDHSFGRMLLEFWINSLLSGPSTHVTNMLGNTILAMWKAIPETAAAAAIGKVRRALGRDGETVQFGEIGASFKARSQSQAAALKAGLDSFERSHSALLPGEKPEAIQGVDPDYMFAAHAQIDPNAKFSDTMASAFGIARGLRDGFLAAGGLLKGEGVAGAPAVGLEYSTRGAIPNVTVKGVTVLPTGDLARLPSRFLSAVDSYFKATNYSMDIAAQAYRAAATAGLEGEAFTARVAYLRANPTPEMMQAAIAETQALTLMGRGGEFTRRLSQLVGYEMPGGLKPLKFVDPFVRVASNIINEAMMKRSPLGVLSPEIRKDLSGANGTIAQDKAMARMLVGTATAVTAGLLAAEGYVSGSGPTDRNDAAMWRLAGNQAHSVRIGEMWYDIHRLGPVGMLISLAADLYEMSHTAAEGDFSEAAAHLHHAITQNVLDQSFMKGPADLIKAIDDPGRYGANYINNFLSSFLPYSVGMGQVARAMDPYSRQARTVVDAMKAKVPGLSTEVMPRRDIWGEPIERPKAVGIPVASAIYGRKINNDPVNRALLDLGVSPAPVQKKIRNVELTPQQYDDFSRIAGRTAKMRLDTIVTSAQWQNWPDYVREQVVRETVKQARETARGMMMMKYPQIMKDAVAAKREAMGGGLSVSARGM